MGKRNDVGMRIPWRQECEEMSMRPFQALLSERVHQIFPKEKWPPLSSQNSMKFPWYIFMQKKESEQSLTVSLASYDVK